MSVSYKRDVDRYDLILTILVKRSLSSINGIRNLIDAKLYLQGSNHQKNNKF